MWPARRSEWRIGASHRVALLLCIAVCGSAWLVGCGSRPPEVGRKANRQDEKLRPNRWLTRPERLAAPPATVVRPRQAKGQKNRLAGTSASSAASPCSTDAADLLTSLLFLPTAVWLGVVASSGNAGSDRTALYSASASACSDSICPSLPVPRSARLPHPCPHQTQTQPRPPRPRAIRCSSGRWCMKKSGEVAPSRS